MIDEGTTHVPRYCKCGAELPEHHKGRPFQYCDKCRKYRYAQRPVDKQQHRSAGVAYERRKRRGEVVPLVHCYLKNIGMDYILLKQAGLIRIPKRTRNQISRRSKWDESEWV